MDTNEAIPHDWKEWRRLRALQLKQRGWQQRHIAEALDVSEAAVSEWLMAARKGGPDALLHHGSPGHPGKLTPGQKRLIPDFLWHGPEAYGFRGELWTCRRVAKVLEWEFGISYHKDHVSRMLKDLGWTPQIPITRAVQRDEEAIERWQAEVWPELKKRAHRERRTLVFVDESGFYLLPGVVRTYGPKGLTPVIYEWQTRDHLSVMGGVTMAGKLYTLVRQESLNGLHSVFFLEHLLTHAGKRLFVVWDGSPIHRRMEVKEFLARIGRENLHLEALPSYAPDLNPVEAAWQHLKHVEMRNLVCLDIEQLHLELHLAIGRLRQKPQKIRAFFAGAGLKL